MTTQVTRFEKAKDALLNAFLNDTLRAGDCTACACGNIIAAACGIEVPRGETMKEVKASTLESFIETEGKTLQLVNWSKKRHGLTIGSKTVFFALPSLEGELNEAGYTTAEFARIENAFEQNTKYKIQDYEKLSREEVLQDQFKGLCAVVDVIIDIDNVKVDPNSCYAQFCKKFENA